MSKPITKNKKIDANKKNPLPQERKSSDIGKEGYVESIGALIDKYIQYLILDKGIPIGIIFVAMVLVIIQDNWTGRLQTWSGWFWASLKCFFLLILYTFYCISRHLFHTIKNKCNSESK